jgi:DNA-binding transcriptional LysR family regulator
MSVFAKIVEAGSISAAAQELDISKSVVSQHLKSLEEDLGVMLLKRTTRRQSLTEAGKNFYKSCRDINLSAETAWQTAQEHLETPKGRIRLTAPNALMETLVTPVIADLMKQYPQLEPELISCDERLDLSEQDIDLAIRVGQSKDSALKQKRIGQFRDVLCGNSKAMNYRNIQAVPYIANVWQGKEIEHEFKSERERNFIFRKTARCTTNSFHSCLALIQSGQGIGLVPDFYLPFFSPRLDPVFPTHQLEENPIYAIHPFDSYVPLSISVCIEALKTQLEQST